MAQVKGAVLGLVRAPERETLPPPLAKAGLATVLLGSAGIVLGAWLEAPVRSRTARLVMVLAMVSFRFA